MTYDRFKEVMFYCKKFVQKMKQENIPREAQKILLKAYLTGFKININEYNINLLLTA